MRIATLSVVMLLLAGCAPALAPTHERYDADTVVVTIVASQPVYEVTATILDATTTDGRCTTVDGASWCMLGDLVAYEVITIAVDSPVEVGCTVAGYLDPARKITSYRPFACRSSAP